MHFFTDFYKTLETPKSRKMSTPDNSLGNSSKIKDKSSNTSDKKCGSNFNALKVPRTTNSRMAQEDNRSNVPSILGPQLACLQFKRWGTCAYGDKCRYVHIDGPTYVGVGVGKVTTCHFFASGLACPYGNECQFLHNREGGKGEYRESSAIRIATSGNEKRNKTTNSGTPPEPKRSVDFRTKFLKTRICTKWKKNGSCSYGSTCQFAHGQAELQSLGSSNLLESSSSAGISAPAKNLASDRIGFSAPSERRLSFKCTNMRKNSQVYADWPYYL